MSKYLVLLLVVAAGFVQAQSICSDAWYEAIDKKLLTADAQGHGPDIGSDEWKSVIEFKLGVRGRPNVPERSSEEWCQYIDQQIQAMRPTNDQNPLPFLTNESL